MAQIPDNRLQIGHMVVGKPLHLCNLPNRHILFPAVDLHLLNPLSCPGQITLCLADFLNASGIYHIIAQIQLLIFPMNIILEIHFHLPVDLCHLRRNAEGRQDLIQRKLLHNAAVLLIKIIQNPIFYKMLRNRE